MVHSGPKSTFRLRRQHGGGKASQVQLQYAWVIHVDCALQRHRWRRRKGSGQQQLQLRQCGAVTPAAEPRQQLSSVAAFAAGFSPLPRRLMRTVFPERADARSYVLQPLHGWANPLVGSCGRCYDKKRSHCAGFRPLHPAELLSLVRLFRTACRGEATVSAFVTARPSVLCCAPGDLVHRFLFPGRPFCG